MEVSQWRASHWICQVLCVARSFAAVYMYTGYYEAAICHMREEDYYMRATSNNAKLAVCIYREFSTFPNFGDMNLVYPLH